MKKLVQLFSIMAICLIQSFFTVAQSEGSGFEAEIQHFVYVLTLQPQYQNEQNWNDEVNTIAEQHFNYLKSLNASGIVLFAGRTDYAVSNTDNFGIVVFQAESKKSAEVIMNTDPAVKNGIMTAELHPFNIVLVPEK